jgi:hypothetical protein
MLPLLVAMVLSSPPVLNDCGGGTSLFKLNAVSLTPADPPPGTSVSLNLDYTVPDGLTVGDGTSTTAVSYNFIPFAPTVEPLCQDIPCPLGPGRYYNSTNSTWPSGLSGTVRTTMTWADQNSAKLLCIGIVAKF